MFIISLLLEAHTDILILFSSSFCKILGLSWCFLVALKMGIGHDFAILYVPALYQEQGSCLSRITLCYRYVVAQDMNVQWQQIHCQDKKTISPLRGPRPFPCNLTKTKSHNSQHPRSTTPLTTKRPTMFNSTPSPHPFLLYQCTTVTG